MHVRFVADVVRYENVFMLRNFRFGDILQLDASSPAIHGGAYFLAVCW